MKVTAYSATCNVNIDVPLDLDLRASSYGGAGVVTGLRVSIRDGRVTNVDGRIVKLKKDGTVGKQEASARYGDPKWSDLPDVIRKEVAVAYAAWVAAIPRELAA